MGIGERKKAILRAIVDHYIETAEPVGSKAIASDAAMALSSATIRNEMAELESLGLLEQPHTSAGRIPTAAGYRLYVNELMRRQRLSLKETEAINRALRLRVKQLDQLISDVGRLTAQVTRLPAYMMAAVPAALTIVRFEFVQVDPVTVIVVLLLSNDSVKNKLIRLQTAVESSYTVKLAALFNASFVGITEDAITSALIAATERAAGDSEGIVAVVAGFAIETLCELKTSSAHIEGELNLLDHPEYRDFEKAQRLIRYLSNGEELKKLPIPEEVGDMKITIGPENLAEELKDSSVVVARYDAGDNMQGIIGVIGPTRMDYSKVAARLSYIARRLSWLLSCGEAPPGISPFFDHNNLLGDDMFGKTKDK